jgi:hypothetical protein
MTREEAVVVLEAFIENPLFSNTHKAAFNIAIHDIKQRHDWDINNLILIKNGTPLDDVLDKIRVELEHVKDNPLFGMVSNDTMFEVILEIIDKYRKGAIRNDNIHNR